MGNYPPYFLFLGIFPHINIYLPALSKTFSLHNRSFGIRILILVPSSFAPPWHLISLIFRKLYNQIKRAATWKTIHAQTRLSATKCFPVTAHLIRGTMKRNFSCFYYKLQSIFYFSLSPQQRHSEVQ